MSHHKERANRKNEVQSGMTIVTEKGVDQLGIWKTRKTKTPGGSKKARRVRHVPLRISKEYDPRNALNSVKKFETTPIQAMKKQYANGKANFMEVEEEDDNDDDAQVDDEVDTPTTSEIIPANNNQQVANASQKNIVQGGKNQQNNAALQGKKLNAKGPGAVDDDDDDEVDDSDDSDDDDTPATSTIIPVKKTVANNNQQVAIASQKSIVPGKKKQKNNAALQGKKLNVKGPGADDQNLICLIVKGFPLGTTKNELKALSTDIKHLIMPQREANMPMVCFMEFENYETVVKNYKLLQGRIFNGCELYVDFTGKKNQKKEIFVIDKNAFLLDRLHCAGIPQDTLITEIAALFPKACDIHLENSFRGPKEGMARFQNETDAADALESCKGAKIRGQSVTVQFQTMNSPSVEQPGPSRGHFSKRVKY